MGCVMAGVQFSFPVLFPYLLEEFRETRALTSLPNSILVICLTAMMPLNGALVFNKGFEGDTLTRSWSNRTRSYFVYALVHLMAYAPEGTSLDPSMERSSIKALALNTLFWPALPGCIAQFENLEYLDLRQWIVNSSGNYDFGCSESTTTFDVGLRCTMDNLDAVATLAPKARVVLPEKPGW